MSGKSYTMKEMKAIVEYLVEHKAYSEIKGRKMWMDMASSDVTSRTWQSLKETFLKRILPDINNPYYKLTTHQIESFKNGNDIVARLNNKLEIESIDIDSSNEDEENNGKDKLQKNNENIEDITAGEDLQKLNPITRDSTDTLILENCNESIEDIKRDLLSPNEDEDKKDDTQQKSLRDLITYSEPLTNLLQNTLDDFATDEEESNGEPQMQIVENEETTKKDTTKDDVVNEIQDSDSGKEANDALKKQDRNIEKKNNKNTKTSEVLTEKDQSTNILSDNDVANKAVEGSDAKALNENNQRKSDITQNSTAITESIPNNQEAFQKKKDDSPKKDQELSTKQIDNKNNRKRASSQEIPQRKGVKKNQLSLPKQSISDSDAVVKTKDKKKLNPKIIEKKLNKMDEKNESVDNELALIVEEKDKNTEEITVNTTEKVQEDVEMAPEVDSPCFKSISVYKEEILCNENRESKDDKKKKNKESINESKLLNDIVILQSHSDSASDSSRNELTTPKKDKKVVTKTREKAMADVFGYSRGAVHKKSKRTVSYRKHSTSHKAHRISSGSSEWTSDSSSEFISPPRGRKNRQTRKYLKPKSARILSLEEEGGLFVMYGKKIYPVVKDGKIIKNYVTYTREEEVDNEESFWKLKYEDEKKKADELSKLLKQIKDKRENVVIPAPALNAAENRNSITNQPDVQNAIQDKKSLESPVVQNKNDTEDKTVKIKFTKNNEEVQLEGHWSHVNPILTQVMQLLQKESHEPKGIVVKDDKNDSVTESRERVENRSPINTKKVATKTNATEINTKNRQDISRQSTPIIPMDIEDEVKEKVNQIENEIFKEIEERDKEDSSIKTRSSQPEENVTKRRGRPRKSSANSSAPVSPNKKLKLNPEVIKEDQQKPGSNDNSKTKESETDKKASEARRTRSHEKSSNETPKETRTRQSLSRKSKEIKSPNLNESAMKTRHKVPSPPSTKQNKNNKTKVRYLMPDYKVHSSPENRSMCSIDSTQGYQDSDESPLRMLLRSKKRINHTMISKRGKNKHRYRTNSHPMLTDDITSESSNSHQDQLIKTMTFQNSTISSEVYSSESYRLLMGKNLTQNRTKLNLEKIPESPNITEQKDINARAYGDIITSNGESESGNKIEDNFKSQTEEYSTSNVSLPTSPVLSVVENMSISKDLLSSVDDFPISDDFPINNEMQINDQIILNNFIKTEQDVSMPLMERECVIETSGQNGMEYHYNLSNVKYTPMSETLINKINTVQIRDPTLTDSINNQLKDLILESTKKNMKINNEVDLNNNIDNVNMDIKENKKKKTQKRSSTPRKRKSSRRLHLVNNEPCIEEHTESCSYSRKSCPPVVQNVENDINMDISQKIDSGKIKGRVKKDIIKVKITKPRSSKAIRKSSSDNDPSNANEANDSESGIFLQCFNDTIDLIHNHSETCLNAHDCMGDSVQLIEKTESVISLDSKQSDKSIDKNSDDFNGLQYDLFSHDARDGSDLGKEKTESATVFHTGLSGVSEPNSLITDDLSELSDDKVIKSPNKKTQSTRWYLFSDDDTTSSNFFDTNQNSTQAVGCASNLEQIFPITCAVPNLSTITEVSNQNDENVKKCSRVEPDARNNSNSQEILL